MLASELTVIVDDAGSCEFREVRREKKGFGSYDLLIPISLDSIGWND